MITNFKEAKNFINYSRQENKHESISGPGSSISNTTEVRQLIQETIHEYDIKSILDLGCGDWNWFKEIDLHNLDYYGWDADEEMIQSNKSRFGKPNIHFSTYDIVLSDYINVDLIICRDVLFHMPIHLANKIINKSKRACNFFISTSFRDVDFNKGIGDVNWGYYPINLNKTPFNLATFEKKYIREMLGASPDGIILSPKRYICLYDFSS